MILNGVNLQQHTILGGHTNDWVYNNNGINNKYNNLKKKKNLSRTQKKAHKKKMRYSEIWLLTFL